MHLCFPSHPPYALSVQTFAQYLQTTLLEAFSSHQPSFSSAWYGFLLPVYQKAYCASLLIFISLSHEALSSLAHLKKLLTGASSSCSPPPPRRAPSLGHSQLLGRCRSSVRLRSSGGRGSGKGSSCHLANTFTTPSPPALITSLPS